MQGKLIQLLNEDAEPIGIWHCLDIGGKALSNEAFQELARNYDDSDRYDEEGWDGFEYFVQEKTNIFIERVYTEEIIL
jgi:hypothetical protein